MKLWNWLKELFSPKKAPSEKLLEEVKKMEPAAPKPKTLSETLREKCLALARTQEGVKEYKNGSNPDVEEYHAFATRDNLRGADDSVPWCSSFMCWIMEKNGIISTNSRAARSWLKWGVETKNPQPGDVVVFWRGSRDAETGHVALYISETDKYIYCYGGNQNDSVCLKPYLKAQLLGYRTYK